MIVDLGCGTAKRAEVGVDLVALPGVDYVCNLGFEPLPFENESVDKFIAWDLLEHIPMSIWIQQNTKMVRLTPIIYLFKEIHRCLIGGGIFESLTPHYPAQEVWQDPTHVSVWTPNTWLYFTASAEGINEGTLLHSYGIDFRFETVDSQTPNDSHMLKILRKPYR